MPADLPDELPEEKIERDESGYWLISCPVCSEHFRGSTYMLADRKLLAHLNSPRHNRLDADYGKRVGHA
jgi:hypothetical protein